MKHLLKLFLILLASLLPATAVANPITLQQAQQNALSFLESKGKSISSSSLRQAQFRSTSAATESYYVFNIGKNEGYVIVSGSDLAPTILGYSTSSCLDLENAPENLKALLGMYAEQISYIEKYGVNMSTNSSHIRTPIAPLLNCKWGQNYPYNITCPVNNGRHCVTGCLATALSQVMYYYKWPEQTTEDIPGYNLYINGVFTSIPSIPAGTRFDWDNMLPTYHNVESTEQERLAVAQLMSAVGTALHMGYNTGTSEAYFSYYNYVPKTYFGYNIEQTLIKRSDIEVWEELIYSELSLGRPVVYGGQSTSQGGHAFVVDGYDGDQLFHVDWGWETSEGYYLLEILNNYDDSGVDADFDDYAFSKDQCAIINLVPSDWEANAAYNPNSDVNLEIVNMSVSGTKSANKPQEVILDLFNKGKGIYGSITLKVATGGNLDFENAVYVTSKGCTIKRRTERTVNIPWIPNAPGIYRLFACINNNPIASIDVEISQEISSGVNIGLKLMSIHMDGEESESMILDPTEQGTTLINVFNNDPNAHIAIKNVGDKRWDGTFRFVASLYNQSTQQYTPYQQRSGSGWGTPGYTWNYERLFSNLEDGKYRMEIYANDTLIDNSWHFVIKDGVAAWLTVNKQRYIPIVNNTIIVPENITAVDLRNRSGLEIIPNNNPNTTYLISSNNSNVLPDEVNTIYCSYYGNTCPNMHLNDGYPYYSPIDFNVENISFRMAINAPGYNTLCIPFTANECKIKRNGIWQDISLRNNCISFLSFSDMINTTVLFDYLLSDSITAWSPYLISMTDNIEELELSGQNLRIQSTPNAMPRTDRYRFQCNMTSGNSYDIYAIVEGSNRFDYQIAPQLLPFRSYFYPLYDFYRDESLIIEINPIPYLVGDVNGDGDINISDVTALIDYLLNGNASNIQLGNADINTDGSVNISDVTALIDRLLQT
jgi:hypothetical protein